MITPRYPIYVPSKNRADNALTPKFLMADKAKFWIVVEPQDRDAYAAKWGAEHLLVLPENNRGLVSTRNWIKQHSISIGAKRHWQIDDNIRCIYRVYRGMRIKVDCNVALAVVEDFTDRYENVGLSGLTYAMFVSPSSGPFTLNAHVYSTVLIDNSLPYKWRIANDDVDMCLQVLSGGLCTINVNAFCAKKQTTMIMKGGNTKELYEKRDGRLRFARDLERIWPYVTYTKRRFSKPQVHVKNNWKIFNTRLKLKSNPPPCHGEYGLELKVRGDLVGEDVQALAKEGGLNVD
jgi:hypothetical protein